MTDLTTALLARLRLADPVQVEYRRGQCKAADGYDRVRIEYCGLEDDVIPAFLLTPTHRKTIGGVVVYHQHSGEFHLGKSEVAGDVGDPWQAFGPALARRGLVVLAPDAITFEDRRVSVQRVELAQQLDTHDVLAALGPRPSLVVSGTEDKYSRDADDVIAKVGGTFLPNCVSRADTRLIASGSTRS